MARIKAGDLKPLEHGRTCVFTWASFEDRCLSAVRALSAHDSVFGFVIHFSEEDYDITDNLKSLRAAFGDRLIKEVTCDREKQHELYAIFRQVYAEMRSFEKIFLDISCFPRDALLIFLLVIMGDRDNGDRVSLIYNLALDYGFDEDLPERKWLSRGVVQIAPVLGFRGRVVPGKELCVIGLLGLDDQRFLQIVENIQPDHLVVGVGTSNDRDKHWLTAKNNWVANSLESAIRTEGKFNFDCDSFKDSFVACEREYYKWEHVNVVILPLNNKISTLAVGILAMRNRSLQVCHGSALLYNMKHYSKSGDTFLSIPISDVYELLDL